MGDKRGGTGDHTRRRGDDRKGDSNAGTGDHTGNGELKGGEKIREEQARNHDTKRTATHKP